MICDVINLSVFLYLLVLKYFRLLPILNRRQPICSHYDKKLRFRQTRQTTYTNDRLICFVNFYVGYKTGRHM